MRSVIRSSFLWQFAGGFAIGAVGVLTLQPGDAGHRLFTRAENVLQRSS